MKKKFWWLPMMASFLRLYKLTEKGCQKAALAYLKFVKGLRHFTLFFLLTIVLFQIVIFSFIATLVTAIFLLPITLETQLVILTSIFGTIFLVGIFAFYLLMRQKTWYKACGANEILKKFT